MYTAKVQEQPAANPNIWQAGTVANREENLPIRSAPVTVSDNLEPAHGSTRPHLLRLALRP